VSEQYITHEYYASPLHDVTWLEQILMTISVTGIFNYKCKRTPD